MRKKLLACFSCLLILWIISLATPFVHGNPPAEKPTSSDAQNGGIVTLYALDPLSNSFSFKKRQYGTVIRDHRVLYVGSDIDFGGHGGSGSFATAFEGRRLGRIIDLGLAGDLQKKYEYVEIGGGQGFASIHMKDGKMLILKGDGGPPGRVNDDSFQPMKETDELFREGKRNATASVKIGHICLLRLTDSEDKKFERIAKFLVISYKELESVTIRWQLLE